MSRVGGIKDDERREGLNGGLVDLSGLKPLRPSHVIVIRQRPKEGHEGVFFGGAQVSGSHPRVLVWM